MYVGMDQDRPGPTRGFARASPSARLSFFSIQKRMFVLLRVNHWNSSSPGWPSAEHFLGETRPTSGVGTGPSRGDSPQQLGGGRVRGEEGFDRQLGERDVDGSTE